MRYQAALFTLVLLACGCRKDISGSYLTSDQKTVCWLQLVRTPDNHLTGQFTFSEITPAGSINRKGIPVTGAINENNLNLTTTALGLQIGSLAGTLQGDKLTLTGVEATPIVLERADLSQYQKQLKIQAVRSQNILAAKQAADVRQNTAEMLERMIARINKSVIDMERFESEADVHLQKLPGAEANYRAITQKVAGYLSREKLLYSNTNATVYRSQLDVAANQTALATEEIHNAVESLDYSFQSSTKPIFSTASTLEEACKALPAPHELTAAQENDRVNACTKLSLAVPRFRDKFEAMRAALDHAQQVYLQENRSQQLLLQESRRLE